MAIVVYVLCALTAFACVVVLFRAWARSREPFLLWAGACFAALFVNNVMLFVDIVVVPDVDLSLSRCLVALAGISTLVFGLVWKDV